MTFVPETIIDQQLATLEMAGDAFEQSLQDMIEAQPALGAYLFAENHEVFTDTERELLLFLTVVIWRSAQAAQTDIEPFSVDQLAEAEEANWEKMPTSKKMPFRDKLDRFFADHPQEDLLALVEDSLTEEEDDAPLTEEGREALFVSLKSIIDVLAGV